MPNPNGMSITISIDLGEFMGNPCPPPMPCDMDEDKLTYFNENNRPKDPGCEGFRDARSKLLEKFGGRSGSDSNGVADKKEEDTSETEDDEKKDKGKGRPF